MPSLQIPKIYDKQIPSVVETYFAGEEKTKLFIGSEGTLTIVHDGNGDPTLETRIYVNGELKEPIRCDIKATVYLRFYESLEIKVYSAIEQEAKNSSMYLTGMIRRCQ